MEEKGYDVREGSIQDATFITSDPGQKRKKKDQEGECNKEGQDSKAIESKQVQELDKGLLDISFNTINDQAKPTMNKGETTNEGSWAKKKASRVSSVTKVTF